MTSRNPLKGGPRTFFFARNNMKCTEIVIQDHLIIRRGLDIIDAMLKKLEDGQRIEIFDATTILKFLRLFGDQYHHAVEENALFPALLTAAPGDTTLLQFVSEHGGERTLVAEIEDALTSRLGMAFFRSSRQLTSLLRNHCKREEIIVCELARCLSTEQDDEIVAEFMTHRAQAEKHANLSSLERRYLPKPFASQIRKPSNAFSW
jgi:hemerythrin-like domain-containing protein